MTNILKSFQKDVCNFIKNKKSMNADGLNLDKQRNSDFHPSDVKCQPTFFYQIANMKAMKIVVLIKISKLKYEFEQMVDNNKSFYLKTQKGQLHKEYEIINFIMDDSRQNQKNQNNSKVQDSQFERGHDSQIESFQDNHENQQDQIVNLCGDDNYLFSKMTETLFELRCNLFPLLDQFYKYLLGHEKIKKIKYESLINKIKSEIAKLDVHMNEHSDIYSYQNSFLNIIVACELFMGCKFVFQQKFRKSKYSLFTKYQKISKKPQFQEIYGKTTMCLKQYIPPEFQIQEQSPTADLGNKKSDQIIPQQIIKLSQTIIGPAPSYESDRNQLLYNYFRSVFTQGEHKRNYFPYFWMMFDCLHCSLIQIVYQNSLNSGLQELNSKVKMLQFQLQKYLKITNIDYGVVGVYQHQNDKHYIVRGILCLGSKNFTDLQNDMESSVQLRQWKVCKIDTTGQNQKREVQNIWENTVENSNHQGVITCSILYI